MPHSSQASSSSTPAKPRPFNVGLIGVDQVGKTQLCQQLKVNAESFVDTYVPTIGIDFFKLALPSPPAGTAAPQRPTSPSELPSGESFSLWDLAGQERFRSVVRQTKKGMDILLLVYDITDRKSLRELYAIARDFDIKKQPGGGRSRRGSFVAGNEDGAADAKAAAASSSSSSPKDRHRTVIVVGTKLDLVSGDDERAAAHEASTTAASTPSYPLGSRREVSTDEGKTIAFREFDAHGFVEVSSKTGEGIEQLRQLILGNVPQPRAHVGAIKLPRPMSFVDNTSPFFFDDDDEGENQHDPAVAAMYACDNNNSSNEHAGRRSAQVGTHVEAPSSPCQSGPQTGACLTCLPFRAWWLSRDNDRTSSSPTEGAHDSSSSNNNNKPN